MRLSSRLAGGLAIAAALASDALAASPSGVAGTRTEVQIRLCTPFPDIERSLKLRAHGNPMDVWLFDDAALSLFERGLRVRLRVEGKHAELTVKVANQDCAQVDARMVPPKQGKCEIDMHGERTAGSVSLTRRLSHKEWTDLVAERVTPGDLLSPVQVAYLRDIARIWPLPPQLRPLGPKNSRAYVPPNEPYEVDVSKLPTGEVYVEMSRKVPVADAQRTREALDAILARAGVATCTDQAGQADNKLKLMLR
jgi:hypothetical protein